MLVCHAHGFIKLDEHAHLLVLFLTEVRFVSSLQCRSTLISPATIFQQWQNLPDLRSEPSDDMD